MNKLNQVVKLENCSRSRNINDLCSLQKKKAEKGGHPSGDKDLSKLVVPPLWFVIRYETGHEFATSSESKISGFTCPHVIGFVEDFFFPFWKADL